MLGHTYQWYMYIRGELNHTFHSKSVCEPNARDSINGETCCNTGFSCINYFKIVTTYGFVHASWNANYKTPVIKDLQVRVCVNETRRIHKLEG